MTPAAAHRGSERAKLNPARAATLAFGSLLVVLAILVSNTGVEQALGRAPHSLAWGPTLWRVLLALHGCVLLFAGVFSKGSSGRSSRVPIPPAVLRTLAALTLIALVLRIPALNSCLWLDEVLTMARFAKPPLAWIFTSFPDQNQHMLYSLLAHGSLRLFGEQAWSLRLPSVLFGAGSVWALFLLGRKIAGDTEALLACALMTVSYHHIWFSQNARGYMGLLFFTLLGTWLWMEAIERDNVRLWTSYIACMALGFWIHMTMLFVLAAHVLIFLVVWLRSGRGRTKLARAAAAFALCLTVTLQLYALSLPEFMRTGLSEVSPPSEWINPLWVVTESLRSLRVGFAGTAVVLCGGVVVAAGWLDIMRRRPSVAWAMVLPAFMGGASMLALGHNLWPRFFFFSMGFGLLIAIRGAMRLPDLLLGLLGTGPQWRLRAGYAFAGLFILASLSTVPRAYALPKQDFTGARDYVERLPGADGRVVVVGLAVHAYSEYYAPQWPSAETADQLKALHPEFLVYTLPIELKAAHPDIWQAVQSDFETVKIFPGTLGGGEVYVCRERAASQAARR
jgi:4-amino-4-deoxy-L-arabinose transferase-like glycosyltransferase